MRPKFLDFSWQRPSAAALGAVDRDARTYVGVVLPPTSWFDDCDRAGVGYSLIFETTSDRAQQGYQAGVYDAQFSMQRAASVGRPGIFLSFVVSDGSAAFPAGGPGVADYGEAVARTYDGPFEFYGNRSCVDAATEGARRVPGAQLVAGPYRDGGWLPVTWGADPARDTAGQEANTPPPIDGTDENTLYHGVTPPPPMGDPMGFIRRASDSHTEWTNGWSFYWDPGGSFEALPAAQVDLLTDDIWDRVHVNADERAAQLTAAAAGNDSAQGGAVDVEAVVAAVLADYDSLPNSNERAGLEASLRAHLTP